MTDRLHPAALAAAAALACCALAIAPAASGAAWESPAFASGEQRPRRIAIFPAQSEMVRTRVNEALPFVKETKLLEDSLRTEAAAALGTLGYEPDLDALAPARIASDRALQDMVRRLEAEVSSIVDVASGKPRDIGRGRFSVGEAVLPLQRATGADAFLWMQSQSIVPSKGQRTLASVFSVLAGTYAVPSNRTQLVAFLVDARSGDLASVALSDVGGPVLKDPAKVAAHAVRGLFEQWPAAGVARKVSAKRAAAEAEAVKPGVPLEGRSVEELDAIARFEDVAARAEGGAVAGPPESVDSRDEFTDDGRAITADDAPPAVPQSLFEPGPRAGTTAPSATPQRESPAEPAAVQGVPEAAAAWRAPAQPATRNVVLQMVSGTPGVAVRNATSATILVSVDLAPWASLAPGDERLLATGPGSHRILVANESGAELARANVLVSSSQARAEVVP